MAARALLLLGFVACGDNGGATTTPDADDGLSNPARDVYGSWVEIQPPGTVRCNTSQYKIWANFSDTSDNLVVVFEPGGACWDYDSCTGASGIRGAANVNGLPDDHWTLAQFISPFLSRFDDTSPTKDWNMIWVPYCTGDVFTGNNEATYTSETDGTKSVVFEHAGHKDIQTVTSWIDQNFTHIPKMLVTGCSAGGVGSLVNYHFLRKGVHAAKKGYMIDDSGPIFPEGGFSDPMHAKIREAWNLDSLQPEMPPSFSLDDMGTINTALADEFPNDRLATTFFRRDYNFSLYSYERFYNFPPKDQIMSMWNSDTLSLTQLYDTKPNLYYFIPYYRNVNESHCTTLFTFAGSDIEDHDLTLTQWVNDFVDDKPITSALEAPVPGEDP